jgi:hypothetical protein
VQESHPLFWKAVPAIITTWRLGSYWCADLWELVREKERRKDCC